MRGSGGGNSIALFVLGDQDKRGCFWHLPLKRDFNPIEGFLEEEQEGGKEREKGNAVCPVIDG